MASSDEKDEHEVKYMSVNIDPKLCKSCEICVEICPNDVLKLSSERNEKGYNVCQVINTEDCIKCRQCEINCPDLAISVTEE